MQCKNCNPVSRYRAMTTVNRARLSPGTGESRNSHGRVARDCRWTCHVCPEHSDHEGDGIWQLARDSARRRSPENRASHSLPSGLRAFYAYGVCHRLKNSERALIIGWRDVATGLTRCFRVRLRTGPLRVGGVWSLNGRGAAVDRRKSGFAILALMPTSRARVVDCFHLIYRSGNNGTSLFRDTLTIVVFGHRSSRPYDSPVRRYCARAVCLLQTVLPSLL